MLLTGCACVDGGNRSSKYGASNDYPWHAKCFCKSIDINQSSEQPFALATAEVGNMEHRYSDRLTANLNIVIFKRNLLVAMGVVKNIGSEGVFIESGFDQLCTNQLLEIEFFSNEKPLKSRRFKAMVVHRNHLGFGAEIENIAEHIKVALGNSGLPQHQRTDPITTPRSISGAVLGYARF